MAQKKYTPPTQIEHLELQMRNLNLYAETLNLKRDKAEMQILICDLQMPAAEKQFNELKAKLDALKPPEKKTDGEQN